MKKKLFINVGVNVGIGHRHKRLIPIKF